MNSSLKLDTTNHHHTVNEYIFTCKFEETFDYLIYREWLQNHWYVSPIGIIIYVISIHIGQMVMKNRIAYELRSLLIGWNFILAAFSIAGTVRILPWLYTSLTERGFRVSCCKEPKYPGPIGFWLAAFTLSKLFELIDTYFVIARKRKLIFLHWYHHASVLALSWYANAETFSIAPFLGAINYCVHSFMYSYYCARAINLPVVSSVPMMITLLQLSQMVAGVFISLYTYTLKRQENCDTSIRTIVICVLIYLSYFVLFAHFFVKRYLGKSRMTDASRNSNNLKIE